MIWNVGTKIAVGFGLLTLIVLLVGVVSYRQTSELIDASEARKQTYTLLAELEETLSSLKDVGAAESGFIVTGDETVLEPYRASGPAIDRGLAAMRRLTVQNPVQQKRLDALEPLVRKRMAQAADLIALRRAAGGDAARQRMNTGDARTLVTRIRLLVAEMKMDEERRLQTRIDEAARDATLAKRTIVAGTVGALVVALLAGWLITLNIAPPLRELTGVAERITTGDLSAQVRIDGRSDEVGALARAFQRMTVSLKAMADAAQNMAAGDLRVAVQPQSPQDVLGHAFARMTEDLRVQIRDISEGVSVLGSAAAEIVASTTQLAANATESAAAVTETTTTVEEVRQTAHQASQKARFVSESAQRAAQVSQTGRQSAGEVVTAMNRIRNQMEAIAASMIRLSEQSQAIGQIIATVEDIATQSNLLAVNAAIEAARAGDQGRGFGVVAQEVKNLAEQSRQATTSVRTILGDIQRATTAAVMATEEGSKAVEAGVRQSEEAGTSIQTLAASVQEAAQAATQISASSQQQLVGVDQVAGAMDSIRMASNQNVDSAQQLDAAARNLNDLGRRLQQAVERYQL